MHVERFSHIMHLVSTVVGDLAPEPDGLRRPRGHVPGGHAVGRAEAARAGDHRRLEPASAASTAAWSATSTSPATRHGDRHPHRGHQGRHRRTCRPAPGIVADSVPDGRVRGDANKAAAPLRAVATAARPAGRVRVKRLAPDVQARRRAAGARRSRRPAGQRRRIWVSGTVDDAVLGASRDLRHRRRAGLRRGRRWRWSGAAAALASATAVPWCARRRSSCSRLAGARRGRRRALGSARRRRRARGRRREGRTGDTGSIEHACHGHRLALGLRRGRLLLVLAAVAGWLGRGQLARASAPATRRRRTSARRRGAQRVATDWDRLDAGDDPTLRDGAAAHLTEWAPSPPASTHRRTSRSQPHGRARDPRRPRPQHRRLDRPSPSSSSGLPWPSWPSR